MEAKDTTCAVCDEAVTVKRNTPKKLQGGVIYHFCSDDCREDFVQNPSEHRSGRRRRSMP